MFFLYLQTIHVTFKGKTKIRNLILCITVIFLVFCLGGITGSFEESPDPLPYQ